MLKVFEAFSGVGSQRMALRNLGINHKVVAIAEIDKYALQSYRAIHGDCPNVGDVSKLTLDEIPEHDLFTYSFPCQDISIAGKQSSLEEGSGTRSSLLWECRRIIEGKKPKYLLLENVKNLVGKKHREHFDKWLEWLEAQGYTNYWQVLNAKEYGIPQNRERVFVVSILGEHGPYQFPGKQPLTIRLKDVLEKEVDEKYYLNEEILNRFMYKESHLEIKKVGNIRKNKHSQSGDVFETNGIAPTLCAVVANDPIKVLIRDSPLIAASRGRYTENGATEQQLEINLSGLCNTLTTVQKDNYLIEETDKTICLNSKGGRNGIEGLQPSLQDRIYSAEGIAPAVTTCFMPNILEDSNKSIRLGGVFDTEESKHQAGSVWDTNGLSPTLDTMQGGYRQPCIMVAGKLDIANWHRIACDVLDIEGISTCIHGQSNNLLTKVLIRNATKQGYLEAEEGDGIDLNYPDSATRRGRVQKGMAQTLVTSDSLGVIVPIAHNITPKVRIRKYEVDIEKLKIVLSVAKKEKAYTNKQISEILKQPITLIEHWFRTDKSFSIPSENIWMELKDLLGIKTDEFDQSIMEWEVKDNVFEQSNRVYGDEGISPTLTATQEPKITNGLRIRKLTPLECWRLMGFLDDDFNKAQHSGVSNSQLYKQAGNSIVVPVLEGIFSQLFKGNDFK